jgi:hypothetical protein
MAQLKREWSQLPIFARPPGVRDRLKYRNVADFVPSQATPVVVCVTGEQLDFPDGLPSQGIWLYLALA